MNAAVTSLPRNELELSTSGTPPADAASPPSTEQLGSGFPFPAFEQHGSVRHALRTIERSVSSMRLVPILALVATLWWGRAVLIPIVLSILISYALEPLVARLESCRVPRAAAVPVVMTAMLAILGSTAYALRGEAVAFAVRVPDAAHTVSQLIEQKSQGGPGAFSKMREAMRELESVTTGGETPSTGVTAVRVQESTFRWSDWMWSGSRSVGEFVTQMFAVMCLTYFLLAAGDLFRRKMVRLAPTLADKRVAVQILAEISRQIERFLLARAAISLIVGLAIWATFRLLTIENPGVWGVLSGVCFAIPVAGPTLVVVASGIAAFVQFGSVAMAAGTAGLSALIAFAEGNILTPWLMGRVGEMNTVAVFISLLFWGWLWGVWGLLLAVPITASLKAVFERVPDLRPMAELLKQ